MMMTKRTTTNPNTIDIGLLGLSVILALLITQLAFGQIGFTVLEGTATEGRELKKYGETYEDTGEFTLKTYDYGAASGTSTAVSTSTRTDSGFPVVAAMRLSEANDQRASDTVRTGVLYFYYNVASECIDLLYKTQAGVARVATLSTTVMP